MDFLRLLVIHRLLEEDPEKTIVYADFDILDLSLFSGALVKRIETYGMAFSGTYYPTKIENIKPRLLRFSKVEHIYFGTERGSRKLSRSILEAAEDGIYCSNMRNKPRYTESEKVIHNEFEIGFMAFNKQGLPLLKTMISDCLESFSATQPWTDPRDITYFSIANTLSAWAKRRQKTPSLNWRAEIASFYVQYCSGWRLDDNVALIPYRKNALFFLQKMLDAFSNRIRHSIDA